MPDTHGQGPAESIRRLRAAYFGPERRDPSRTLNIHFIIEGKDYGRGRISSRPIGRRQDVQASFAFFCSRCGKIWATAVLTERRDESYWLSLPSLCPAEPAKAQIPGSLWRSHYPDLLASFPPEVLKRELLLHLDYFERTGYGLY